MLYMEKEVVLITGANGMLAKEIAKTLDEKFELRFLTRKKKNDNEFEWNLKKSYINSAALANVEHIIHLAGAGIGDKKWTKKRKLEIKSSRIDTATLLLETLQKNKIKITSFISASAIGFYGTKTSDKIFSENDAKGNDFLSDVCFEWEKAATKFESQKIAKRTVILRIGVILSKEGGVLRKMLTPMNLCLAGVLGKGNQYMPWIHIKDLCSICRYMLENKSLKGVFNAVSPEHISNKEFTKMLAKTLNKPICLPNIPSFFIKTLFGERSVLLLNGSKVSAKKIIETGFKFKYIDLKTALFSLLRK